MEATLDAAEKGLCGVYHSGAIVVSRSVLMKLRYLDKNHRRARTLVLRFRTDIAAIEAMMLSAIP